MPSSFNVSNMKLALVPDETRPSRSHLASPASPCSTARSRSRKCRPPPAPCGTAESGRSGPCSLGTLPTTRGPGKTKRKQRFKASKQQRRVCAAHCPTPIGSVCVCLCVCTTVVLICTPHQQAGVIVSPNSFVQSGETVPVPEIQVSSSLDQHPDPLHGQAGLQGHRERSLWPTERHREEK